MADNNNLHISRVGRTDEFYTQLTTIEDELGHYRAHFRDRTVLCNCDDPYRSNFFRYFVLHFRDLGLKKLIATCLASPRQGGRACLAEITRCPADPAGDFPGMDALLRYQGNCLTPLRGDGDFRSPECREILAGCDVVVTNPPFSLMGEYLPQLIASGKRFIILGNVNHITLGQIKPCILREQCWLGYNSGHFWFMVPDSYDEKGTDYRQDAQGQKWRRMGNSCWFTNIDIRRHHTPLPLRALYDPARYPRYDDLDAIECPATRDIPADYFGVIGVPVTYLPYHCAEQFEILDIVTPKLNGKSRYKRLLIRRR